METMKNKLSQILQLISDSLDISEGQFENAKNHYRAVGEWLNDDENLSRWRPEIYPQGSFRLGTVVKPIDAEEKYDVDLVCELQLRKNMVSQEQLKLMIGKRLKENEKYRKMLQEGRRCWMLEYADSTRFHMDILPAIPDFENRRVDDKLYSDTILITDKKLHEWQHSNPKGYAEWFIDRMRIRYEERRKILMEELELESIDDVPEYAVKMPLQRAIQLLKRHRDIMFEQDKENKPISIIITTLAALSYNNEDDVFDALMNIAEGMPLYIKKRGGVSWVANPVNNQENFADKWKENAQLEERFRNWLHQVSADLRSALNKNNIRESGESLLPIFGKRIVNDAINKFNKTKTISIVTSSKVEITNPSKPWSTSVRE